MARRKITHPDRPVTLYIVRSTDEFILGCMGIIGTTEAEALDYVDEGYRQNYGEWVVDTSFPLDPSRRWDYGVCFSRWEER